MADRTLQVLLVDGQVEDSHWVRELLADFGEHRFGSGWMHDIEIFPIDRLGDAVTLLGGGAEQFDAILLNPNLPDCVGLHSLHRLQTSAPGVPILILAELDDLDLAMSMVRAGAQDFLAKSQLDSIPLARALRLAVERNKTIRQLRAATWRDDLTGLANRSGFDAIAGRDLTTARRLDHSLACLLVDLDRLDQLVQTYGKEERELALIEASEIIRASVGEGGYVARVEANRFAVSIPAVHSTDVTILCSLLRRRLHHFASNANRNCLRVRYGLAWFHPNEGTDNSSIADLLASAAQSLCENMGDIPPGFVRKERHFSEYAYSHRRDL